MLKDSSNIDNWPNKLKLLSILSMTKEFLTRSQNEGWVDINPLEIKIEVNNIISYLLDSDDSGLSIRTSVLYAPTGPIQEISIANGWSEAYMLLSEEYDKLEYLIKRV